ncbi:MAG: hypothetical protein OEV49_13790 [candidate division Zixibacteria bacterium]|nr:hypothetical protein [candidate division Zixibacteria bacterium]MDH3937568.1 hypothetical protein [candidate division Zixibacteria bacterium]MDH4034264.1 hypothetical protein [candidate division Zixibacteria bacterium]
MEHFALWLGAFLTLGILSFLYKDNPWYKLSEAIFVGISAGFWVVTLFWDNLVGKFWDGWQDEPMLWVGMALGILMIMRLVPKIGWISRWPLAFIVGSTAGLWLMNFLASNIMVQTQATIMPLLSSAFGQGFDAGLGAIISNLVIVIGTFTGLVYFFFSKEHTGAFGGTARVGIFFIMITFGASFGYTVMSRMSLLIGRIDFLLGDWLGMIG